MDDTPIVLIGSPAPDDPPDGVLVWPCLRWRVTFGARIRGRVNVFEKATMGLIRTGMKDPAELAGRLGLDQDLMRRVILIRLLERGFIDRAAGLTDAGRRVLDEEAAEMETPSTVSVLQDAYSEDILEGFVTTLNEAEIVGGDPLTLRLGTTGHPLDLVAGGPDHDPFAALNHDPERPHAHALLRVLDAGCLDAEQGPTNQSNLLRRQFAGANRILTVAEQPERIRVAALVYVDSRQFSLDVEWPVSGRRRIGALAKWRRWIERESVQQSGLNRWRDGLVAATAGGDVAAARERRARLRNLAVAKVSQGMGSLPSKVADAVIEMQMYVDQARESADESSDLQVRSGMLNARLSIELLLQELLAEFDGPSIADRMNSSLGKTPEIRLVRNFYQDAARRIGFTRPLPVALSGVKWAEVWSIFAKRRNPGVRSGTIAAILGASYTQTTSLRAAAKNSPDFLEQIDLVADACNKAIHGAEGMTVALLSETASRVIDIARLCSHFD